MEIKPEETELIGKIFQQNGSIVNDDVSNRINHLTTNYLMKIATDESGWDTLHQDPIDKRFWEKVYPQNEIHGGGPPSLINISPQEAKRKYNL